MKKFKTSKLPRALTPFGEVSKLGMLGILGGWLLFISLMWINSANQETRLFPTPSQVWDGFIGLWDEGLMHHVGNSLKLCSKAVLISVIVSISFAYLSTVPLINPLAKIISKMRYLPLTGISFYITMMIDDARTVQVYILVAFMTTFLTTGLLSMIKDIEERHFDHARALGYSRWKVLIEVVIKGRFDYVIETIRQNLAIVWMMLVTVESIMAATGGLGFLIKNSDKFMNHGRIIALQFVILLIGLLLDYSLTFGRKLFFRYSQY